MQTKSYQQKTLERLELWIEEIKKAQIQIKNIQKGIENLNQTSSKEEAHKMSVNTPFPRYLKNYPALAWDNLRDQKQIPSVIERNKKIFPEYISRTGDNGQPIPHVCLKIPTGGGKTFLGVSALQYLKQDTGFVLWVVPTKAIYRQTIRAFRTREHPYRQILENISGGRVKILEKGHFWTKQDVQNYLCLMVLMLPSANRQKNKKFLKIFRDSGAYSSFFPEVDDVLSNQELIKLYPDLNQNEEKTWVKQSLINVFKMIGPTVILDEAHKAYGPNNENNQQFVKSINRLNPRFVLELSATPKVGISNILVNISGTELKAEEMIKIPVEIHSFTNSNWKYTLAQTQKKLNELEKQAIKLHAKENRYIRPIALVRVEQTGKAQIGREGRIHAEQVKCYLIKNLNVPKYQIRIQSSEKKELRRENLISEYSQVRWIITKDALKEGWDCSFAYILALLDNTKAKTAITQMVGRVMRQPGALQVPKIEALNRCYIYCFNQKVSEAVQKVKDSLQKEGLTGVDQFVYGYDGTHTETKTITLSRRKKYKNSKIFLPQVLHKKGKRWLPIDYDRHILSQVNWNDISGGSAVNLDDPDVVQEVKVLMDLQGKKESKVTDINTDEKVTLEYFVRRLEDVVPNPWQISRIAEGFIKKHQKKQSDTLKLLNNRVYLSEVLKKRLKKEVDKKAEQVFRKKVQKEEIRFRLETDEQLNYEMEHSFSVTLPVKSRTLQGELGQEIQYSLFEPVFESAFDSEMEKNAAIYLDKSNAIHWWHKIAARQAYYLQGWKRHKVYPDFLAYRKNNNQLFIIELKGEQFKGSRDTIYKEKLMGKLEDIYKSAYDRGEMKINSPSAVLRMMFEDTWEQDLKGLIQR